MITPKDFEDLTDLSKASNKHVFFFMAEWCPGCQFIQPQIPEIESKNPDFTFVKVDCNYYMVLANEWNVRSIPSFVVTENGREIARLVNHHRKTQAEINNFLAGIQRAPQQQSY